MTVWFISVVIIVLLYYYEVSEYYVIKSGEM